MRLETNDLTAPNRLPPGKLPRTKLSAEGSHQRTDLALLVLARHRPKARPILRPELAQLRAKILGDLYSRIGLATCDVFAELRRRMVGKVIAPRARQNALLHIILG